MDLLKIIGVDRFFDLILGVMSVVGVIGVIVGEGFEERIGFFFGLFREIFFVVFRYELNKLVKDTGNKFLIVYIVVNEL